MIKCDLGVISPGGLLLQYIFMAFEFHNVTTWAKICAFNFVSLSRYCPPSLRYSLLNLEDAVAVFCPFEKEGGVWPCAPQLSLLCSQLH
jgi:hypothetical protein